MTVTDHVTCLGCGLACDDIAVTVADGRITEARNACPLGRRWFGDGIVPTRIRVRGRDAERAPALRDVAALLGDTARPLVYLAPELSTAAQRAAVALADVLHAMLDTVTTATAGPGLLAAQRRGRCGATLGELRNRADLVVFWGVDPALSYPRLQSRYFPDPPGIHVTDGRRSRTVIAIDVGADSGPSDADERIRFTAAEEVTAVALTRAAVLGKPLDAKTAALAERLVKANYVAIVVDGEPRPERDAGRAEAILALAEALNGPTRCAVTTLRAGGNRVGAESVLTWQTGYPMAVDFATGAPRYDPGRALAARSIDAVLVIGAPSALPLPGVPTIVIGPRASATDAEIAIDTGVAGIHEDGTAVRSDDIPLPLRAPLAGTVPDTTTVLSELLAVIAGRPGR